MSTQTETIQPTPARFPAFQYRDYRLLWSGQLVSQLGSQMQQMALNYHVYLLTHSPLALGLISLARFIPVVVLSLVGGVFADAHDRRRVLFVTQSGLMIGATLLSALTFSQTISVPALFVIAALLAAMMAFDGPARQSLTPNLVPKENLTNALSLNNIVHQTAGMVGPAVGGFVIGFAGVENEATVGVGIVYLINAISFLGMLLALFLIKAPTQNHSIAVKFTRDSLTEGVRFVHKSKMILATMLLDFIATFFSSATSLLPIFAKEILHVGAAGLGILYAAESVGAVIAGAAMSVARNIARKGKLVLTAVAVYGIATTLYGMSNLFWLSIFFLAIVGAADTISTIMRNTLRQLATPDHLRGRMTGVNMIFFMGGPRLGDLEAGLVAALIGAPLSVITGGIATVIAVMATAWLVPQLREYTD
ncbi:MAG: MFS transporter [Chloroflexi bacterium]|nr:MFS transporter [Chloroflexota bacterium]